MPKKLTLKKIFHDSTNLDDVGARLLRAHPERAGLFDTPDEFYQYLLEEWRKENAEKVKKLKREKPTKTSDLPYDSIKKDGVGYHVYSLPHGGIPNIGLLKGATRGRLQAISREYEPDFGRESLVEEAIEDKFGAGNCVVVDHVKQKLSKSRTWMSRKIRQKGWKKYHHNHHLKKALTNPDHIALGVRIYNLSAVLPRKFELERREQRKLDFVTSYAKIFAEYMQALGRSRSINRVAGFVGFEHSELVKAYLER